MKETARKTVQFFHSFREKFWRDEVEDQENEICPVAHESTEMQKHRHFEKVTTIHEGISYFLIPVRLLF